MIIEKVFTYKPIKKVLIIYKTSYGLYGEVKIWNSCTKKWDKSMGASFYEKYKEATTYRVKEYFNFNTSY